MQTKVMDLPRVLGRQAPGDGVTLDRWLESQIAKRDAPAPKPPRASTEPRTQPTQLYERD